MPTGLTQNEYNVLMTGLCQYFQVKGDKIQILDYFTSEFKQRARSVVTVLLWNKATHCHYVLDFVLETKSIDFSLSKRQGFNSIFEQEARLYFKDRALMECATNLNVWSSK